MSGPLDRLMAKTIRSDAGCLIWTASMRPDGYGQMSYQSRPRRAHRVSYELHFGTIPDGMEVDHTCRVRACVNPDHLRLATRKQNAENQGARGASGVRGVSWHKHKKCWRVQVHHNGRTHTGGYFAAIEDATAAAIALRNALFTHNIEAAA